MHGTQRSRGQQLDQRSFGSRNEKGTPGQEIYSLRKFHSRTQRGTSESYPKSVLDMKQEIEMHDHAKYQKEM